MKISEVTVKVVSIIEELDSGTLTDGESERTESMAQGYYHVYDGGRRLLTYTESSEGGGVTTEIEVCRDTVTVTRTGAIESRMSFCEGRTDRSLYSIPPYRFDAEVKTRRLLLDLREDKGKIELSYNMKIGGAEKSAVMKIWILPNTSHA